MYSMSIPRMAAKLLFLWNGPNGLSIAFVCCAASTKHFPNKVLELVVSSTLTDTTYFSMACLFPLVQHVSSSCIDNP